MGDLGSVVDGGIFHTWPSQDELMPYLSSGWRSLLSSAPRQKGPALLPPPPLEPPGGRWLVDHEGKPVIASDMTTTLSGYRRVNGDEVTSRARLILTHDLGRLGPAVNSPEYGREISRAANDWTIDHWLSDRSCCNAFGLVPTQVPEWGAAEARRVGANAPIVGLTLAGNGLGRPFGHPVYEPIHAAASELDLPLVVGVDSDPFPITSSFATAGGMATTFSALYALRAQPLMGHATSFITQGVFERFANLRLILVGGGFTWVAPWLWRLDADAKSLQADQLRWLRRLPSEQFQAQIGVSTHSLRGAPSGSALAGVFSSAPWLKDTLFFASGYPRWDADPFQAVMDALPAGWRSAVSAANADRLFRWGSTEA